MWGMLLSVVYNQDTSYDVALFFGRAGDMAAVFIPATWFHFVLVLVDKKIKSRYLLVLYFSCIFIAIFSFTPWFIPKLKSASGLKYYMHPGPLYHLFTMMFFTIIPYGFVILWQKINRTKDKEERSQFFGLFIATLAGFVGGGLTFLPIYGLAKNIPQYNLFLMPFYPFAMAYFMIRHKLFDVEQIAQSFQREKLATIGLISASINHEIRNPLYAVKSLLETYIGNEKEGLKNKTPLETSESALKQVGRALEVIQKLNRFAKPASETNASNSQASIQEAIKSVLDLVSYEFELDRIHIKNNLDPNLSPIQADQRQLEEILFNLIVNACHAMTGQELGGERQGGILTLNSRLETQNIVIEIQDTGTGISPEQAKHLFEPFHTTKGDKGTGLGLYITKQLVERNGGKISVQSQEGKGTSFVLEFRWVK